MFNNFNLDGCKILKDAEKEREKLNHPYVGSEHLLLSVLKNSEDISRIFQLHNISYALFKKELIKVVGKCTKIEKINLYTPLLKRIIANSLEHAEENNNGKVLPKHYIIALIEENEGIAFRLLISMNVDIDKLHKDLMKKSTSDQLYLNEVGTNLNDNVNIHEKILNRDEELDNIIQILIRKKKNNPILIGEAGVGKTAIVEELARRIVLKKVPDFLIDKKIIMLEMGNLVAGTKYRGEFEEKLSKIIKEVVANDNIIIFIDEIHTIINAGGAEGAINASDILKPYLARGDVKCIGATTPIEYEKSILKDKALSRRFEKIIINEPDKLEIASILNGVKKEYEDFHKVKVTKQNIQDIIELSDKYITEKYFPDKAIDLLDTVCAYVKVKNQYNNIQRDIKDKIELLVKSKEKAIVNNNFDEAIKLRNKEFTLSQKLNVNNTFYIDKADIIKVIHNKLNKPLNELQLKITKNISSKLKSTIKNNDKAIDDIIKCLNKHFISESNKPLALHLLVPKSIDKNIIAKIITESYVKKYPVINIDFKEFKESSSLNRLIGVSVGLVGYDDDYLLKKIKDNIFAIVVIDNFNDGFEKAKDLIKNIVEKGYYMNGKGEIIHCLNTLFVLFSKKNKTYEIGFCCNNVVKLNNNKEFGEVISFEEPTLNTI